MPATDDFVHLYNFMSADEFSDISADLYDRQIRFQTRKTGSIGPEYVRMQSGLHELELWVHPEDVKAAMALLNIEETKEGSNEYVNHATESLINLLKEPIALEAEDMEAILKELSVRGATVSEDELNRYRSEHMGKLKAGIPAANGLIAAGFLCAMLGGVLGFIIGFRLLYLTDVYPQGEEFLHYNAKSRFTGKAIILLSALIMFGTAYVYFAYLR